MAKYVIEDTTLTNTANAIREKTGGTEPITPSNFATEIASIETGGGSSTVTKGIIINEFDSDGYVTDASVVGMTTIPENYFYRTMSNSDYSFFSKVGANLHLPNDLTSIGKKAFYECANLGLTELPSGITSIGEEAFNTCVYLKLTSLPEGLTEIPKKCFYGCSNITLTKLPSGITSIGEYGFSKCSKITLTDELPSVLTSLGGSAFSYCEKLAITKIPSGITSIPSYCFSDCETLTSIEIQGSITKIDSSAFRGDDKLSQISLPNVTSVPTLGTNAFANTSLKTGYIYVPDDLVDSFKSATNWSTYADQIKPISELEASA